MNRRELSLIRSLLPPTGSVLDLASGTGRLSDDLAGHGYGVVAIDASPEMLRVARERTAVPAVQGDAFALPFDDGGFDAVVALRLIFHYADARPILSEMARVTRPGGSVVFDTYRWTPRSLIPLAPGRWGGKVFAHRPSSLLNQALGCGLVSRAAERCFLFSPYVYRLLPLPMVQALAKLETVVPPGMRARVFWKFERTM